MVVAVVVTMPFLVMAVTIIFLFDIFVMILRLFDI